MTDDELRAWAIATDQVIQRRIDPFLREMDDLRERTAECERLLGIEQGEELLDAELDGWRSGDQEVFYGQMEGHGVNRRTAKRMVDRRSP